MKLVEMKVNVFLDELASKSFIPARGHPYGSSASERESRNMRRSVF